MADKQNNAFVPPEGLVSGGGIKKRWILNNMTVVLGILIVFLIVSGIVVRQNYYNSMISNVEMRAESQATYINSNAAGSYSRFYEYSRQSVEDFADKDKLEMQILDEYGRVMFSSAGLTAGYMPVTSDVPDALKSGKKGTFVGRDSGINDDVVATTSAVQLENGEVIGGVRFVSSTRLLKARLRQVYMELGAAGLAVTLLIIITNTMFLQSIVNPILQINLLARKIAGGQLGARLDVRYRDEIGELCKTINDMSEELARSEKVKNEFISSVSHELRTPLTAINGWSETVENSLDDPEMAKTGLKIIKSETARLSQMVEELLDFSRLESGRMKLQMDTFDIRGEVYDAVFTYHELLRKQNLTVNYNEPEEAIYVFGDKNRLKQVYLNILDNAAKYGSAGDSVDINVYAENGQCIVTIADHGQGIPENELPKVKEKFFKGSAYGRGAGIGLAVCNEIMALHSGSIDVTSQVGKGTCVTVRLPAKIQEKQK